MRSILSELLLGSILLCSLHSNAAIFGDANPSNGVEDDRITKEQATIWPDEFRSVGRIVCDSFVQGSAVLFNKGVDIEGVKRSQPMLLTAKHVFAKFELSDCYFSPESFEWERVELISVLQQAKSLDFGVEQESAVLGSLQSMYEEDWVILGLKPWPNWQKYALLFESIEESYFNSGLYAGMGESSFPVSFVGYDLIKNQIVIDEDCELGIASQTPLLNSSEPSQLLWDDCDSEQGSSGGALFILHENEYLLVGIRVGSIFDKNDYDGIPEVGGKFDLDSFINVGRALPF